MIQFVHVSKSFAGNPVLDDLSGEIPHGKIVTIVGPSGAGKSTLLSLCNLLVTPDTGEVHVNSKEVRTWNIGELRRYVGLVFQAPTMFPGTVEDNLMIGPKLRHCTIQRPEHYLQNVGLPLSLLNSEAESLSGGQKQRVALARVLVNDPKVLLLDEVTSALDPLAAKEVEDWILKVQRQNQMTVVWVTHNLQQAKRVGDMTWLLASGKIIESLETDRFFTDPKEEMTRQFLAGDMGAID